MKTIQISDGLWKRLKLESVERGVTMREMVEEMGVAWEWRQAQTAMSAMSAAALRGSVAALEAAKHGVPEVRELKVELETDE